MRGRTQMGSGGRRVSAGSEFGWDGFVASGLRPSVRSSRTGSVVFGLEPVGMGPRRLERYGLERYGLERERSSASMRTQASARASCSRKRGSKEASRV